MLLLGFSGGPDSLALASILKRIATPAGVDIAALHIDHGLRSTSDDEQHEARRLAADLGLRFRGERLRDEVRSIHPGVGLEEAARRERYAVFARVAAEERAAMVVLAHHQDDQAETLVLHLLRGAGLAGVAGMSEVTELSVPWWTIRTAIDATLLRVWRPLLSEPRQGLREYLAKRCLVGIEDPSNADLSLQRNAVRSVVLPALTSVNPTAADALARFARLAADDDALLRSMAEGATDRALDSDGGLSRHVLRAEPEAIRRRLVRCWIERVAGGLVPSADRVEAVVKQGIGRSGGWTIEIGESWMVMPVADRLWIGREEALRQRARAHFDGPLFSTRSTGKVEITNPGSAIIGNVRIDLSSIPATVVADDDGANVVNLTQFGELAVLRPPAPGDRWARSGRKVGDWLTSRAVPAMIRPELVCLATELGVHWIAGLPLPSFERGPAERGIVAVTVRRVEE
jgi:tRNA(Ile)-lysidine synthase